MPAPLKHTVSAYCNILPLAVFILYAVMLLCALHLACLHALCNVFVGMILLGTMVKCLCTALNYMYIRMVSFYATYCNRVHIMLPKLVGNARHDLLLLVYRTEVL